MNLKNIIEAANITGADSIHPGFGFLSENSQFAKICEESNIKFIGPSYKVIELIYKDTSFSSKYIELLKKPSLYGNAMRQSSQKVQMLFIWEYLNKLYEDNDDKLLKDLLELADIRNKLAHESGELLEVSKVAIAHAISNFMLQHFILNT